MSELAAALARIWSLEPYYCSSVDLGLPVEYSY
jgi:hypothetical protein